MSGKGKDDGGSTGTRRGKQKSAVEDACLWAYRNLGVSESKAPSPAHAQFLAFAKDDFKAFITVVQKIEARKQREEEGAVKTKKIIGLIDDLLDQLGEQAIKRDPVNGKQLLPAGAKVEPAGQP